MRHLKSMKDAAFISQGLQSHGGLACTANAAIDGYRLSERTGWEGQGEGLCFMQGMSHARISGNRQ